MAWEEGAFSANSMNGLSSLPVFQVDRTQACNWRMSVSNMYFYILQLSSLAGIIC